MTKPHNKDKALSRIYIGFPSSLQETIWEGKTVIYQLWQAVTPFKSTPEINMANSYGIAVDVHMHLDLLRISNRITV